MINPLIFFVDVDNTLLNNDLIKLQLKRSLVKALGQVEAEHFWAHHDEFRAYQKLVDFPNIIRSYCAEQHTATCELVVSKIFSGINFKSALYPKALEVLAHLKTLGKTLVFSEGDEVYQKMKIAESGIEKASDGVLLYKHKIQHLPEILKHYPNSQLVFIDDRDDKLREIKLIVPKAYTIVVCQGHYAKPGCRVNHSANMVIASVAELSAVNSQKLYQKEK